MAATQIYYMIALIILAFTITATSGLQNICQWEKFEAKCQGDEVIMIKEAQYGRLGVGRCQPRDFGFAGCSADVTAIMHSRCSGRQHCVVSIPDPVMFAATPCPKDLVTYLQADYECIKVAKHSTDNCNDQILTAVSGDLAKPLTTTNSYVCPQRILAQPGQTVNVYLYDFSRKETGSETTSECITYGFVSEGGNAPTKICGGEFRKDHLIYSSDSNVVDIMLIEGSSHSHHFIVHYEIIGCPTFQAPPNSWVKIEDNTATVMCNFSHVTSNLVCSDNEWVGDMQNCTNIDTESLIANSLAITSITDIVANTGTFAIICVGLACGVFIGVAILAFIKARRLKNKQMTELPHISALEKPNFLQNEKSFKPVDEYQPVYLPASGDNRGQYAPVRQNNLYEVPRPDALSTLHASHVHAVENPYGRLGDSSIAAVHNYNQAIYNITGLQLDHDNVITMDNSMFS